MADVAFRGSLDGSDCNRLLPVHLKQGARDATETRKERCCGHSMTVEKPEQSRSFLDAQGELHDLRVDLIQRPDVEWLLGGHARHVRLVERETASLCSQVGIRVAWRGDESKGKCPPPCISVRIGANVMKLREVEHPDREVGRLRSLLALHIGAH